MRRSFSFRMLFLPLVATLSGGSTWASTGPGAPQVIYVRDMPGMTGIGSQCDPWTHPDGTGGIHTALERCGQADDGVGAGSNWSGCTIVLPKGIVRITNTINTRYGLDGIYHGRWGLTLRGFGSGLEADADRKVFGGTTLQWFDACPSSAICPGGCPEPNATGGGTVLRVEATSFSRFENFRIDGGTNSGTLAGIGLDLTATPSTVVTQHDQFENIAIHQVNGIGLRVGPADTTNGATSSSDWQVSESQFDNMQIDDTQTGIRQSGQQTTDIHYSHIMLTRYQNYGVDFVEGSVITNGLYFANDNNPYDPTADVRVQNGGSENDVPEWALFQNNYHETGKGHAYLFEAPTGSVKRTYPTTFLNTRVYWDQGNTNKIIDYRQNGPLTLIGNTFQGKHASDQGEIYINVPYGSSPATISSFGNMYTTSSPGEVKMVIDSGSVSGQRVHLVSNDDPTHLGASPLNATSAHLYTNAGIVYERGSLNWKNSSEAVKFKQYLNGSALTLTDGSNAALSWWDTGGNLHLATSSGAVAFEGGSGGGVTSLNTIDPGSLSHTISLPTTDGAVVTSAAPSTGAGVSLRCGTTVLTSAVGIPAGVKFLATNAVPDLAVDDVCTCSTGGGAWSGSGGGKFLPLDCYGTANTLNWRLYNAGSAMLGLNTSASVNYCCSRYK